jgi:hypothetical protein
LKRKRDEVCGTLERSVCGAATDMSIKKEKKKAMEKEARNIKDHRHDVGNFLVVPSGDPRITYVSAALPYVSPRAACPLHTSISPPFSARITE